MPTTRRAPATVPTVEPRELLAARDAIVIDLRSPAEFAEDHMPGAVNVPLFDDLDRALIGTLYKKASPAAAFEAGRERAGERIERLVRELAALADWRPPEEDFRARLLAMTEGGLAALEPQLALARPRALGERRVILYCWRGGLRSRSVTSFVRALGLERACALRGGYKAYRRVVREELDAWSAPPTFVLRGLTGVGKTLVLRELETLRQGWTVDLEALAEHRSSILGMVGRTPCTQKTFETRLYARLARGFDGAVVLEGESRKIGDTILPPRVWDALDRGTNLELVAPLERRVEVLVADYLEHPDWRAELRAKLPFLERRLGPVKYEGVLTGLLDAGRERELAALLLERYYDRLYRHSDRSRSAAATIDASDPRAAAREVASWIEARLARG